MRNSICMLLVVAILIIIAGCSTLGDADNTSLSSKVYTHEELTALSGEQLLNLFIENGLEINDELRTVFTEEELQKFFKAEFEILCQGITARSAVMYFDLANQTKEIYEIITCPD